MSELSKSSDVSTCIDSLGHPTHTPGPWTVWQLAPDSDPRERHIVVAGEDYGIEVCGAVENIKDAELIAAAPEILKALSATREWLGSIPGSGWLQDAPIEQIEAAIRAGQGQ